VIWPLLATRDDPAPLHSKVIGHWSGREHEQRLEGVGGLALPPLPLPHGMTCGEVWAEVLAVSVAGGLGWPGVRLLNHVGR